MFDYKRHACLWHVCMSRLQGDMDVVCADKDVCSVAGTCLTARKPMLYLTSARVASAAPQGLPAPPLSSQPSSAASPRCARRALALRPRYHRGGSVLSLLFRATPAVRVRGAPRDHGYAFPRG